jgi:anti-sigma B factor antagonist
MATCEVGERYGATWVTCHDRVDTATAPEIDALLEELIDKGARTIVMDLDDVRYVSSAGLRIFIKSQKRLKELGGEIIFYRVTESVMGVLVVSGMFQLYRFFSTPGEVEQALVEGEPEGFKQHATEHVTIEYAPRKGRLEELLLIGDPGKLAHAAYTPDDIVTVPEDSIAFGAGLAATGRALESYAAMFGESVILNHELFTAPANAGMEPRRVPRTDAPDIHFLHGYGFSNRYHCTAHFESREWSVNLEQLVEAFDGLVDSNVYGFVILAETKGVHGTNLKRAPFNAAAPADGASIFALEHVDEWVTRVSTPEDTNALLIGVGLAVRDLQATRVEIKQLFSDGERTHMHAAAFDWHWISSAPTDIDNEVKRIVREQDLRTVAHVLNESHFAAGLAGLIELET